MKYLYIVFFVFAIQNSFAQSWLGLSLGANFSQAQFVNSDDVNNNNLKGTPGAVITGSYQFELPTNNRKRNANASIIEIELGYKSANFKDNSTNILTTWNMQYLTSGLIYRYMIRSTHRANPFVGGGFVVDYLMGGTQNTGFNQYDLKEYIEPINLSVTAEVGLSYDVSEEAYATLRLGYLRGLTNVEKDMEQKSLINSWRVMMALYFDLNSNRKRKR